MHRNTLYAKLGHFDRTALRKVPAKDKTRTKELAMHVVEAEPAASLLRPRPGDYSVNWGRGAVCFTIVNSW